MSDELADQIAARLAPASKATIPDYLLERIGDSVEMLRGEVLT